jgi:hypothetical protein
MSEPLARFPGTADVYSWEDRVDKAIANSAEAQLRSAFPEGVFTQVDVLGYGDDPDVEPGETAIRAFVDRAGHRAGTFEDDEVVIRAFGKAHSQVITWLHRDGNLPSIAWVQLIPDTPERRAPGAVLWGFPSMFWGMRRDVASEAPGFADVRTRLGPEDLATVDALIKAGIASSRAEAMRWAIGRIRENPASTQIQERLREIGEPKDHL